MAFKGIADGDKQQLSLGLRGRPPYVISKPGLNRIVIRYDKHEARAFQDWEAHVVLPAIEKDGGHVMGEEKVRALITELVAARQGEECLKVHMRAQGLSPT